MHRDTHKPLKLDVIRLVFDFMRAGNPLAASLPRETALSLSSSLRQRLNVSDSDLNFSPYSLRELDTLLPEYKTTRTKSLGDTETIALIRELAAYVGEVLARHTDGQWIILDNSIWGTRLKYDGKWSLLKENQKQAVSGVSYSLGDLAASAWQNAVNGESPQLFQCFENIKRKILKEKLTYNK